MCRKLDWDWSYNVDLMDDPGSDDIILNNNLNKYIKL